MHNPTSCSVGGARQERRTRRRAKAGATGTARCLKRGRSPPTGLIHHPSPRSGFVQGATLGHGTPQVPVGAAATAYISSLLARADHARLAERHPMAHPPNGFSEPVGLEHPGVPGHGVDSNALGRRRAPPKSSPPSPNKSASMATTGHGCLTREESSSADSGRLRVETPVPIEFLVWHRRCMSNVGD